MTWSRRAALRGVAAGAAALAGCGGDGTDDPETPDGPGGTDAAITGVMRTNPAQLNWSPFHPTRFPGVVAGFTGTWGALTFAADAETVPVGFADWRFADDGTTLEKRLRDDLRFWDGGDYAAADLHAAAEVDRLVAPDASPYERLELIDDRTVRYRYRRPRNPDVGRYADLDDLLFLGRSVWTPWLERLREATSATERDAVLSALRAFELPTERYAEDGLGTGPYRLTDWYQRGVRTERWDGHARASDLPIAACEFTFVDEAGVYQQSVVSDRLDFDGRPLGESVAAPAPDHVRTLVSYQGSSGRKLLVNWRTRPALRELGVRRAMAAALDGEQLASNRAASSPALHTGMDRPSSEAYLGDALAEFLDYGAIADYEAADAFLAAAGYGRRDGTVVDAAGAPLDSLRFLVRDPFDRAVGEALADYGFPLSFRRVFSDRPYTERESMTEWDLAVVPHRLLATPHPVGYFDYDTVSGWRLAPAPRRAERDPAALVSEWLDAGRDRSPYTGKPLAPPIPARVGARTLDGDAERASVPDLLSEARTPVSRERTAEIVGTLAWAWNFLLPDVDVVYDHRGAWGDAGAYAWPDDRGALTSPSACQYALKQGLVRRT